MKSFFTMALLGVVAVQGISVSSTNEQGRRSKNARNMTHQVQEGKSVIVSCPYNDNRKDRIHNGVTVKVNGMQTSSADNKTDDNVDFWFSFENLGLDNNTVRGRLYQADGRTGRKAALKCEMPDPTPTIIAESIGSNTDNSEDNAWQTTIDGTTFSLWNSRTIFRGSSSANRERLIWQFDAFDSDGNYVEIGCCELEEENDDDVIVDDFEDTYASAGLLATAALFTSLDNKYCMLQQNPTAPAADVAVKGALVASTSTTSTGVNTHSEGVTTALADDATEIPKLQSLAIVTTTDGFCGGLDLVYVTDIDADVYNTGVGPTVGTATLLTDADNIKHVKEMYSSADSSNANYLALKFVIEDTSDNSTTTLTCGNFQDTEKARTNMICNPYSTVLGFSAMTAANGALTSMTIQHLPVFGGVSVAQTDAWKNTAPPAPAPGAWFAGLTTQAASSSTGTADGIDVGPSNDTIVSVDTGTIPVIDSIEIFNLVSSLNECGQVVVNYKNTTPSSITYDFGSTPGIAGAGTSLAFTVADTYLQTIQYSDDTAAGTGVIALNFQDSAGGEQACGNFDAGSATTITTGLTAGVPVIFAFDTETNTIDGITVYYAEYDGIDASQECIRDNDCPP